MEPNAEKITVVTTETAQPLRRELRSWGRDLVIAMSLAVVIIIFFYQPVKVEGTSMTPLISDQERIFINKFVYRWGPVERGDRGFLGDGFGDHVHGAGVVQELRDVEAFAGFG